MNFYRSLVIASVFLSTPSAFAQQGPAESKKDAVAAFVADLEVYAQWSQENGVFGDRDRAYAKILEHKPLHELALKTLRYSKQKDGTWKQKSDYKMPKNGNVKVKDESEGKWKTLVASYIGKLLDIAATLDRKSDPVFREGLFSEILAIDPDNEKAHALRGEVKHEGKWVLADTGAARDKGKALAALAKDLLAKVGKPEPDSIADDDQRHGVKFTVGRKTKNLRILGTGSEAEVERAAAACQAAADLFNEALDVHQKLPLATTGMLLSKDGEREACIRALEATDAERERYRGLAGCWIPKMLYHFIQWRDTAEERLDGAVRQTIGLLMLREFNLSVQQGWAWEGFGLHLTFLVVETRLTFFTGRNEYGRKDDNLESRLSTERNWLPEALKVMRGDKKPNFRTLFGRHVNDLTPEETLISYAIAQYFLEARPDAAASLLRNVAAGATADLAFTSSLGLNVDLFEERFLRWLMEMK